MALHKIHSFLLGAMTFCTFEGYVIKILALKMSVLQRISIIMKDIYVVKDLKIALARKERWHKR